VVARSEAEVCGRSPAEIVGWNLQGLGSLAVVCVVCCMIGVFATS